MTVTRLNPEYQPIGSYAAANHTHSNYDVRPTRITGTLECFGHVTSGQKSMRLFVPLPCAASSATISGTIGIFARAAEITFEQDVPASSVTPSLKNGGSVLHLVVPINAFGANNVSVWAQIDGLTVNLAY